MARTAPRLGGGNVNLDATAFEATFNMPLVHESVRAELNARRRGTASTLTRGEVRGGGAKPWRQKGTGRARAGSSRSPIWKGGGTVFGPSPRGYTFKVNRKAHRAALRSALSVHAERESVAVFDTGAFAAPSTKQAASLLEDWGARVPTLVLLTESEAEAGKSFRNLARVAVMAVGDAGVADVIGAASLLISEAALAEVTARAAGNGDAGEAAAEVEAPTAAETETATAAETESATAAEVETSTAAEAPADETTTDETPTAETPEEDAE